MSKLKTPKKNTEKPQSFESSEPEKKESAFSRMLSSVRSSIDQKVRRLKSNKALDELTFEKPIKAGSAEEMTYVKRIVNGIIETTDGSFVKIQEVNPILFSLLSDPEKTEIVTTYASWLRVAPMTVQIKTISRRANPAKHIAEVRHDLERETFLGDLYGAGQCRLHYDGHSRPVRKHLPPYFSR